MEILNEEELDDDVRVVLELEALLEDWMLKLMADDVTDEVIELIESDAIFDVVDTTASLLSMDVMTDVALVVVTAVEPVPIVEIEIVLDVDEGSDDEITSGKKAGYAVLIERTFPAISVPASLILPPMRSVKVRLYAPLLSEVTVPLPPLLVRYSNIRLAGG